MFGGNLILLDYGATDVEPVTYQTATNCSTTEQYTYPSKKVEQSS